MPRLRNAEHALRLVSDVSRQKYICRTCYAQQTRTIHASPQTYARRTEKPLFERLRENLFGTSKSKDVEAKEEAEAHEKDLDLARKYESGAGLERRTRLGGDRQEFEVAAVVDPEVNSQYVRANTFDGLNRVGGTSWAKRQKDEGEVYVGYVIDLICED
jgi:hypothetical protein